MLCVDPQSKQKPKPATCYGIADICIFTGFIASSLGGNGGSKVWAGGAVHRTGVKYTDKYCKT